MSIKPVNNHILISPLKHDSFLSSEKTTYEELGIVIEVANGIDWVKKNDKVYFDSWLAAKFPTGKGNEYFWLVRWEDIRAVEKNENPISK